MYKAGDKFEIVSGGEAYGVSVGDVVTWVGEAPCDAGYFKSSSGFEFPAAYGDNIANISTTVCPLRTEAEKRGAKFGVGGVLKYTGERLVFISDNSYVWRVIKEGAQDTQVYMSFEIRLDHEPEFVAWSEAPERLRYDASRVYYDGEPVKWIAKPEGAFTDVVVVQENGIMRFSTHNLTVKL